MRNCARILTALDALYFLKKNACEKFHDDATSSLFRWNAGCRIVEEVHVRSVCPMRLIKITILWLFLAGWPMAPLLAQNGSEAESSAAAAKAEHVEKGLPPAAPDVFHHRHLSRHQLHAGDVDCGHGHHCLRPIRHAEDERRAGWRAEFLGVAGGEPARFPGGNRRGRLDQEDVLVFRHHFHFHLFHQLVRACSRRRHDRLGTSNAGGFRGDPPACCAAATRT